MSEPQSERPVVGDYRLDVKDFGPIAKAGVDLRPLTVFVGPSNTGKSYLAILIYVLHKTLHECFSPTQPRAVALSPLEERDVLDWAREAILSKVLPEFPQLLNDKLRDRLQYPRQLDERLLDETRRCFSIWEPVEAARHQASHRQVHIALSFPYESQERAVGYDVWLSKTPYVESQVSSTGRLSSQLDLYDVVRRGQVIEGEQLHDRSSEEIIFDVLDPLSSMLLAPVSQNVYYLPAARSGVMNIHQAIVSSLIQNAATVRSRSSMLPGGIADFLGHLIRMPTESSPYHTHAERLERHILQGTIRMERSVSDYPEFFYRPEKGKSDLPLMRASSMVSELAPVVLYLRYLVRPGDVLIIEEPEAHLHPAMQAAFARELTRLVRSGVRIIMTTHSEWFLEKIGNLVRLSELPKKKRAGIEDGDVALCPHEVGAWLFKPRKRPKGSMVEEVKLDPETGLFPTDYGEVTETLYNEGAKIFNRLQEGDEE